MALPPPKTRIEVDGEMQVGSKTDDKKRYIVKHFDDNAYSCSCMAWIMRKTTPIDVRTCKHLRDVLGDEHEDARCGVGAGIAKGPAKKKKSAPPAAGASRTGGSSSSPGASTSASYSTAATSPAPVPSAEDAPPKRVYAAEGSKKRAVAAAGVGSKAPAAAKKGKGKGKAAAKKAQEEEEEDSDEIDQGPKAKKAKERKGGVELLLAHKFDLEGRKKDPTGWWISEKLDGVRAYWDGESTLWSRVGNPFAAPPSFTSKLPKGHQLDGELFIGRDRFDETSGIVRSMQSPRWDEIRYMVFDIPSLASQPFELRLSALTELFPRADPATSTSESAAELNPREEGVVRVVEHEMCEGWEHLERRLGEVRAQGGEGLMLRQPGSTYVHKRSTSLLKVKTFYDAEARVVGYEPGKGKYEGLLGALQCVMQDGKTAFSVGSGLTDARRADPPAIGSIVTYRFQELTKAGVPRFPTFVGERIDVTEPKDAVLSARDVGGGENGGEKEE
ncbi:hypothetical protein JCM10449v2_006557 [Rhodotorula kratochvilovae]